MMGQPDAMSIPDCCPVVGEPVSCHTAGPEMSFKPPSPVIPSLSSATSFPPVGSTNGSTTVVDANARLTGSWSATTCAESNPEICALECKPVQVSQGDDHIRSPFPDAPPNREQFASLLEKLNSAHRSGRTETLERFLKETDAPWSQYNLKLPGTLCAICGIPFTGLNHQGSVARHIRSAHPYPRKDPLFSRTTSSLASRAKTWPTGKCKDQDVAAVGSWPYDIGHSNRKQTKAAPPRIDPLSGPRLILCDHPYIPHDRLLFLLNNLNPRLYPERANNFFNSLDIVAGNLTERYPNDVLVQGIRNALSRLEHLYQLNFSRFASEFNQWATTTAPGNPNTYGVSGNYASSTPVSGTTSSSPQDASRMNSPSTGNSNAKDDGSATSGSPKNALEKSNNRKKSRRLGRLLACPIRKHDQIHDQNPSCDFDGKPDLWGVTSHLKSRTHRQFIALCRICWEYAMSQEEYEQLHSPGRCRQVPQPRRSRVPGHWLGLYTKMFPQSLRLPSPYVDDPHWKPKELTDCTPTAEPRLSEDNSFDFSHIPNVSSFLGDVPDVPIYNPPDPNFHDLGNTAQDAETIAIELFTQILREHINPHVSLHGDPTDPLISRASMMAQADVDMFSDRLHAATNALIQLVRSRTSETAAHDSPLLSGPAVVANQLDMMNPSLLPPDNFFLDALPFSQGHLTLGVFNPLGVPTVPQPQPQPELFGPVADNVGFWQQDSLPMGSIFSDTPELDPIPAQRSVSFPWMSGVGDAGVVEGLRSVISA